MQSPSSQTRIAVIGGGPAGLLAAATAASLGAEVHLFEKKEQAGAKLLITGHGRCNLTNTHSKENILSVFGTAGGRFLKPALYAFDNRALIKLFEERLGIPLQEEARKKIYPKSGQATDIRDALVRYAVGHGVHIHYQTRITKLHPVPPEAWFLYLESASPARFDKIILSTGGASYPSTGSEGDGYPFASAMGHTIRPPRPGIAPLLSNDPLCHELQGLDRDDVAVTLFSDQEPLAIRKGDLLFTHFGLSGPAAMDLAREVSQAVDAGKSKLSLTIDFFASKPLPELRDALLIALDQHGKKKVAGLLETFLPERLVQCMLRRRAIPKDKLCHQITKTERERILEDFKNFPLSVTGTKPLALATVTTGGVALEEVASKTMMSRVREGLYFAGELLDLDGPTGGFNLQAAFSTGYLAGYSAGRAR